MMGLTFYWRQKCVDVNVIYAETKLLLNSVVHEKTMDSHFPLQGKKERKASERSPCFCEEGTRLVTCALPAHTRATYVGL